MKVIDRYGKIMTSDDVNMVDMIEVTAETYN